MRDRLEGDRAHRRVGDPVPDDRADLVLVDALLDRGDERHRQPQLGGAVERPLLVGAEVLAADREVRLALEAVELQVQMRAQLGELLAEAAVAREPDPVRVQHHRADSLRLGERDHLEDLRMDRRLAARELHHLRLALGGDEAAEHEVDLLERQRVAVAVGVVAGVGEADRAVEVAGGVHLDDREAGVLLVLGAQAAVERTAVLHLGLELERQRARLVEPLLRHVELRVRVDERLEEALLGAALAHDHAVVAHVHLGVDHRLADRADRLGVLEEDLVPVDLATGRDGHALSSARRGQQVRCDLPCRRFANPSGP